MPQLGDIVRGKDIGRKTWNKYIWAVCRVCEKERWVMLANPQSLRLPKSTRCVSCMRSEAIRKICGRRGRDSFTWKGGKYKDKNGYVLVWLSPDSRYFPMAYAKNSTIMEHRLIMAEYLGRCLYPWELVHHKNHIRDDNRIENLELATRDGHWQITLLEEKIKRLEDENAKLKDEIAAFGTRNS